MCQKFASPYQIDEDTFSDGVSHFSERHLCQHCRESREAAKKPFRWADERYSFGYYAGKYCDECWLKSGYRDATDPDAEFDETYAGESLHGEDD